jgi:hypothetical protein
MMSEDLMTDDGHKLLAFTTGKNSIHIVSADGGIAGFGRLTVIGTNVIAVPLDWQDVLKEVMKNVFGLGDTSGQKSSCETTTTMSTGSGGTSMSTHTSCSAG